MDEKCNVRKRKEAPTNNGYQQINDKIQLNSLPEKVFATRESLLTELCEHGYFKTLYNFFVVIFLGVLMSEILNHFQTPSSSFLLFLRRSFGKPVVTLSIWVLQLTTTFLAFLCFQIWASVRSRGFIHKNALKLWDVMWITVLIVYYLGSFHYLAQAVVYFQIPGASSAFVLIDGTRLLMKVHAFVRTSAPEILNNKCAPKTFTKYLYFLFAPTLLYRDEYPRTKQIRWWYVAKCFAEILVEVLFCSILCEHFLLETFSDFGQRKYTWLELTLKIFRNVPVAALICLVWFYCVQHSWQNAFAEMLTFGDRLFYKDWWTSTTYSRYYRTWNVVVQDWLYTYIYKDVWNISSKNKVLAKLTVIFVSAVVHEYLLTFILSEFFPFLFINFFFVGTALSYLRFPDNSLWNVVFLYTFCFGFSLELSMYTVEWHARYNFPVENETRIDFLMPRMFTCNCIV